MDLSPKDLKYIISMLPDSARPRIGGSYNLYLRGLCETYRDIDIIVDSLDNVNLPYPKIELIHLKRLNPTIKYCIKGREVDIIESLFPNSVIQYCETMEMYFETTKSVYDAKRMIAEYTMSNNTKQ